MKKKGKRVRFAILAVLVVFLALAIFSVFPSIVSIPGSNHSILGGISNVLSITGNAIRNAVNSSQAPAVIFPKANRSSIGNLKIGTPSPSKFGFAQAYSIDASGLDFKSADVKAVAKGNYLFKCKDWDFALQSCSGSWVTIMNGLSVGQGYDFSLTRGDPGFAEINITTAQHLDENRSVISDIYPQISAQDGIWSEPVYANQYVRAWFSENMTNGNVINIYARNNQSSNTSIEVYEKDGSVLLASTPVIAEPGMYDVALSNMNDSSDTFDLKIFNADNDSNAYLEFDYLHDAIFNTGASNCSAEQTATKGSFGAVCNGTYPAACGSGGSYLGCADGYNETHSMTSTGYAGVRIKQYNLSVSDCQSVDSVYLCYKWNTTDPGGDCYIAIDNQNGTNFTNMTTTCPVGAPSFTCTNVTLNKTWACENFFSSSGNKSMIRSEARRSTGGGTRYTIWDALYFNVSYTAQVQGVNTSLVSPADGSVTSINSVNFTCNATTAANLTNITFYWNYTGTWQANGTNSLSGTANSTAFNRTSLSGKILWNCYACNNQSQCAFAPLNFTVNVNSPPTQSTPILNSTFGTNLTTENLTCYNQSTADPESNPVKSIYNWFINGTSVTELNIPFEGGSNSTFTKDYSGFANNGVVLGATWNSTGGHDGKGAYMFDGGLTNDSINITDSTSLNITTAITLAAWVKVSSNASDMKIFAKQGSTSGGYKLSIYNNGSLFRAEMEVRNASSATCLNRDIAGGTNIVPGNWYYVVGVYDNSSRILATYINGQLDRLGNTSNEACLNATAPPLTATPVPLVMGMESFAPPAAMFNGTIDDAVIYSYALSPAQINSLYQNKTNMVLSQDLAVMQNWTCKVTPNDGTQDGTTLTSNSLLIMENIAPTVLNLTPAAGNNYTGGTSVNITANVTDNYALDKVFANITWDSTSLLLSMSNSSSSYNLTFTNTSAAGLYNVTIIANDSFNNINNTVKTNFTIQVSDAVKPAVTLNLPANDFNSSSRSINFNWTATDNIDTNLTCNLSVSNAVNATNVSSLNNTATNLSVANFADATYLWNVTCWDDTPNTNVSATRNFTVDATLPNVTLVLPSETSGTYIARNNIVVNSTAIDAHLLNVTIKLYNLSNLLINSTSSATSPDFVNYTSLADGIYYFNATGYDSFGNKNTTETRNITIDTVKPSVTLNLPAGGFFTNVNSINFNWTATNGQDLNLTCNLSINNVVNISNVSSLNNTATNRSVGGFANGLFLWNVTCIDDAANVNTSVTSNFTVDAVKPVVNLNYPPGGIFTSNTSFNFNWTATDNIALAMSCNLSIDNSLNASNIASANNTAANYTVSGFANGLHWWNVTCSDNATNINSSATLNFTVDSIKPGVQFVSPTDASGTFVARSYVQANTTASDANSFNITTRIYNSTNNLINTSFSATSPLFVNLTSLSDGIYFFNSTAYDLAGNLNSTGTRNITLDTVKPAVSFAANTEVSGQTINRANIVANATANDSNLQNTTSYLYNSSNVLINLTNSLTSPNFANFTNLSSGIYFFNASAYDLAGNFNYTETRNVTISLDAIAPVVSADYPPSGAVSGNLNTTFNCSGTDNIALASISLVLNGAVNATNTVGGLSNLTSFNVLLANNTLYSWNCNATDTSGNKNTSAVRTLTINSTSVPGYNTTTFSGNTTNWSAVPDLTNVCNGTAVLDNPLTDKIVWNGCVNAVGANFTQYAILGNNNVTVNFGLNNTFNSSATITIRNLTWDSTPVLYRDGIECNDTSGCVGIDYNVSTGTLTFNATHFTSYVSGTNAQLRIWDETDTGGEPFAGYTRYPFQNVTFFAHYNRTIGGNPAITDGTCVINFTNAAVSLNAKMTYNSTYGAYIYNRSFPVNGTFNWNVTCNRTLRNTLNTTDTVLITNDTLPPGITLNYPPGGIFTSNTSFNFNWTPVDNVYLNITCNLTIDNVVNTSNINTINNTATNQTVVGIANGLHFWNVTCRDLLNNSNTSVTRNFSVDTVSPTVNLNAPAGGISTNVNSVNFNWTATNGIATVLSCNLSIDGTVNASYVSSPNNTATNYTVANFANGLHLWNVTCNDSALNVNTSLTRNFTVDTIKPAVALNYPQGGIFTSNTSFNFNWTATDNIALAMSCNLSIDNSLNASNIASANNTAANYTVSGLANGLHTWNVTCNDSATNINISLTNNFTVDTIKPGIQFVAPTDTSGTFVARSYVQANTTASDANSFNITTRIYNSTNNLINTSFSATSPLFVNLTSLSDGIYFFNSTAYDLAGNTNSTETRNITIDTVKPSVNLNYPPTGIISSNTSFNFNWTATNGIATVLSCNLSIDGAVNVSAISSLNGSATNYSVAGFADGFHLWNVTCNESAGNFNTSLTNNFTVDTVKPTVNLNLPANGIFTNINSVNFNWTATNGIATVLSCNLSIDNAVNKSGISSLNGSATNYSVSNLADGFHLWNVTCNESAGNFNTSLTRNFTIDTVKPSVTLNLPANGIFTNINSINFNWTATNGIATILSCNLSIDGAVNVSAVSSLNGSATNYSVAGFADGLHLWNVTCNDSALNINTSLTRNFTIDTVSPSVNLSAPANGLLTNASSINFNWTASNGIATVLSCNLSIDNAVNKSGISSLNGSATNYSVLNIADGLHWWNVTCNESAGNVNTSATWNFTVDTTKPGIQFVSPTDASGTFVPRNYIQANVTATDANSLNITWMIYNSLGVLTDNRSSITSPLFVNYSGLANTIYYFNATAYDSAGNRNVTEIRNVTIDTVLPAIRFAAPTEISGTTVSRNNIVINVTVADANLVNATVRIYDSLGALVNTSNTSVNTSVSPFFSNFTNMANGLYLFNATAYDKATNTNSTLTRNVTLDTVYPYVNLNLLADGTITGNNSVSFNWTAVDNLAANMSCNLSIDGIVNVSNVQSLNYTPNNYTVSVADGLHLWNVSCADNAGNFNFSATRNFTVEIAAPVVNLNAPSPGIFTNINSVNFNWTASNGIATVLSCNLSIDGAVNVSAVSSLNGSATNYSVANIADGLHLWNVTCNNSAGNVNTSLTRNFTVDTVKPSVNLNSPANGLITANNSVNFNWTATNGQDLNLTCNLSINGVVNASNVSSLNNTATNFSVSNLADGFFLWNVTCIDDAGNFNTSVAYNFSVNTGAPTWSNVSVNETLVYWNQSVLFSTVWNNTLLAGYIFSTNLSGGWVNTSFIPFGGTTNVSQNVSVITADNGTVVGWFFWANDSAGNFNQTPVQNFTVQSRPTTLAFSVNQSMYAQGRMFPGEFDVYIPFNARYVDSLTSAPIDGAGCYVTNNETTDNVPLVYNATTGNYTGEVSDNWMYDNLTFNVSCSKVNYVSAVNFTMAGVWWIAYLWEWQNVSYDNGSSTTHWLRKNPANGPLYTLTEDVNASVGSNKVLDLLFCGPAANCSYGRAFNFVDPVIRLNLSLNDSQCAPLLCVKIIDPSGFDVYRVCSPPVAVSDGAPTLVEFNFTDTHYTVPQDSFHGMELSLNCTSAVSERVQIYYNYSGEPANMEIRYAHPFMIAAYLFKSEQLESNYTLGPNSTANITGRLYSLFNNTGSTPQDMKYDLSPPIQVQYPDSIIPNTTYIYNSTGQLWASDDGSAPNNATIHSSTNQIEWVTEHIPGDAVVVEPGVAKVRDAIRDQDVLLSDTLSEKVWNVSVFTIFVPYVGISYNVTVFTNYSAYGVPDNFAFNVSMIDGGGTMDISGQVTKDVVAKTLTFPVVNVSGQVSYLVTATDITPPSITFISPTPNSSSIQNLNYTMINASATNNVAVDSCLLEWNGTNESMAVVGSGANVTCWVNKTGLLDGFYAYRVWANDSAGLWNYSETRNITIDTTSPQINFTSPTPANDALWTLSYLTVNASVVNGNPIDSCLLEWNGTNESMAKVGTGTNVTCFKDKTSLSEGNYSYRVYANDSAGNFNVSETRNVKIDFPPKVTILYPLGEIYDKGDSAGIMINATDSDGINSSIAEVTLPNSSIVNITLFNPPEKDSFDFNTMGIAWSVENASLGPGQTCVADIATTVAGKAFTSISGNGLPKTDTLCSLVSKFPLIGDFDLNVSFDTTAYSGNDISLNLQISEKNSSINSGEYIFMALSNWTGPGSNYEIFAGSENFSDYILRRPTNETSGKFRIKRTGNNFTFYIFNSSDSSWTEENVSQSVFNLNPNLFITLEAESAYPEFGAINVTWDNLETGMSPNRSVGIFSDTRILGLYNITIYSYDSFLALNDTEKTNFTVVQSNDIPTTPFILAPYINEYLRGIYNITWSDVADEDNDSLQFNITLLNANLSENATLASNYGNSGTNSYSWNTLLYPDGNYSLKVTVFENATPQNKSNSYTMIGAFILDNTFPIVQYEPPTETSGSFVNRNFAQINVTVTDNNPNNITIYLYNSTGSLINSTAANTTPNFANYTGLADGIYFFNATAYDKAGNSNSTETRNVTIDTVVPSVGLNSPASGLIINVNSVNFNWTATNGQDTNLSCNLTINGTVNASNIDSLNNTATNYSVGGFADGFYLWNVTCADDAGNFNASLTRNFTVDLSSPVWSNPLKNETAVYWNSSVKFNATWTNAALAGYIFYINQTGSWENSGYVPFGGTVNVSENISLITASVGTNVSWYFWANDSAGNYNQTDIQSFTVQERPTSLTISTDKTLYSIMDTLKINARYIDTISSIPVTGATCIFTNDETSDSYSLVYNATTGNYTYDLTGMNSGSYYGTLQLNISCSKTNYVSQLNSTSADIWLFLYLRESASKLFDGAENSTTYMSIIQPSGSTVTKTFTPSLSAGSNLIADFNYCGTGINCSLNKGYQMNGTFIMNMNLSINDTACKPYLCYFIKDISFNKIYEDCDAPEHVISNDTPTLINSNITDFHDFLQQYFLGVSLYMNCTAPVNETISVYYNDSATPAMLIITSPRAEELTITIVRAEQLESNYTIGPNQNINSTRKAWFSINNSMDTPAYTDYIFTPRFYSQYTNSIVPNTTRIYNSTGSLWASDNASAGAPNVAIVQSSNQIKWTTETVQNNTVVNETVQSVTRDIVRDNETLLLNNLSKSVWQINLTTIVTTVLSVENVSAWTNYSTYGVPYNFKFTVNLTNISGTYDITSQITINTTDKTLTFPMMNMPGAGITYVITATDITPPSITFIPPTPNSSSIQNLNYTMINASATNNVAVDSCLLEWNGTNESMAVVGSGANVTCWVNKTGLLDGFYAYRVWANDSAGLWNYSETRNITIDMTKPAVELVPPTDASGISVNRSYVAVNVSAGDFNFANVTVFLFNYGGSLINSSFSNLTGLFANFTGLANGMYYFNATAVDRAGNSNSTETRNITIDLTQIIVTIQSPLNQTYFSSSVWFNATINKNGSWCAYSLDGVANVSMSNDSATHFSSLDTNVTEGNHSVSFYCNDTLGSLESVFGQFAVNIPPVVFIENPKGESYDEKKLVPILVNATDAEGISYTSAMVTLPNGSEENISFSSGLQGDNFDSDSLGSNWFNETGQTGPSQDCVIDINGTVPGKAYISLSGNGSPVTDTFCSLVSSKPIVGDFDINISFEILNATGTDMALNFILAEIPSYTSSQKMELMALANWSGYEREYEIFVDDNNFSGYLSFNESNLTQKPTSDSFGKFRIKRVGDNFTFFTFNNTEGQWIEEATSQNSFNFNRALYVVVNAESAYPGYGSLQLSWDDLGIEDSNLSFAMFNRTSLNGLYNVSVSSTDSLGAVNGTEKTNFTILFVNDPPSIPFILAPYLGEAIHGTYNVTWSQVTDEESDLLVFNLTLINPDTTTTPLVSYYGNSNTTSYNLNTLLYLDGDYSMTLTVFENQTPETLSTSYTIEGNFTIDNTPPNVSFVGPTPPNGSIVSGIVVLNATAADTHFYSIGIYNETDLVAYCEYFPCDYTFNTSGMTDGAHTFYALAYDLLDNAAYTDNLTLLVEAMPPSIEIVSPIASAYNYTYMLVNLSATDLDGVSQIWFDWNGTNTPYTVPVEINFTDNSTIVLTAYANDTFGNINSTSVTFSVNTSLSFVPPPEVSGLGAATTNSSAEINFTTNENANSTINYGINSSLGTLIYNSSFGLNHSILIPGLQSNTTYYYNVTVCSLGGNCNTSGVFNFTTLSNAPDTTGPAFTDLINLTVLNNESLSYDINATDPSGVSCFRVNDTAHFSIDCSGLLTNATGLSVRNYKLNITANDTRNNNNSGIISVNVTNSTIPDTNGPVFDNLINLTVLNNQSLSYDINATDPGGVSCFRVNDTASFRINCNGVLRNATGLSIGIYWLNITVNDTLNNNNSGIIFVNVTNSTIPDTTPPVISSVSSGSPSNASAQVTWTTDESSNSTVNFGTTTGLGAFVYNSSFVASHSVNLSPLVANTTYYYNVTSCDIHNNCNTSGVFNFTTLPNAVVNNAPSVALGKPSNNARINNTDNVTLNFTVTDDLSATLSCDLYINGLLNKTDGSVQNNTLTNLELNVSVGTYTWKVNCSDGSLRDASGTRTFFVNDTLGPSITMVSPLAGTYNYTYILVNLTASDASGISKIWFNWNGTNTAYTVPVEINFTDNSTINIIAYANDTLGNINSANATFAINTSFADVFPPVISGVNASTVTNDSAIIAWTTGESGNSTVNYGTTDALGTFVENSSFVTSHSVDLPGLQPNTTYFYNVTSCDVHGNCNTSGVFNFTTGATIRYPPAISALSNTTTNESANLSWTTNIDANSTVNYGTDAALGTLVDDANFSTSHLVSIAGLLNSTLYYYNITRCDNESNCNTTGPYTFTTQQNPDTTPPVISGITNDSTNQTARINWTTDELANSTVEYGTTDSLGSVVRNSTFAFNHSIGISGLSPTTLYYYNITSCDQFGNCNTSGVFNFTTTANIDLTPPVISGYTIEPRDPAVGNFTFLNATAADDVNLSGIFVNITLPNGTIITLPLPYNYSPPITGRYNVTIFANDTSGNIASVTSYFIAGNLPLIVQVNIMNNSFSGIETNLTIFFGGTNDELRNYSFIGDRIDLPTDILYDLLFRLYSGAITVRLNSINFSLDTNSTLGVDKTAVEGFLVTYGIFSNYTFSNAILVINYSNTGYADESRLTVYRCANWNFTGRACISGWVSISSTQNTANKTFEVNTTGFSAYSIKQEAAANKKPAPSSGGHSVDLPPSVSKTPGVYTPPAPAEEVVPPVQEVVPAAQKPVEITPGKKPFFGMAIDGQVVETGIPIAIVIFILIVLVWLIIFFYRRRKKKGEEYPEETKQNNSVTASKLFENLENVRTDVGKAEKKGIKMWSKLKLFLISLFKGNKTEKRWARRLKKEEKIIASQLFESIESLRKKEMAASKNLGASKSYVWIFFAGIFILALFFFTDDLQSNLALAGNAVSFINAQNAVSSVFKITIAVLAMIAAFYSSRYALAKLKDSEKPAHFRNVRVVKRKVKPVSESKAGEKIDDRRIAAEKPAAKEHSTEKSEILTERDKILNELKEAYK